MQPYALTRYRFEAARQLDYLPDNHVEKRLHGHSFLVRAAEPVSNPSLLTHAVSINRTLQNRIERLNYQHLNTVLDQPNDINIARWLKMTAGLENIDLNVQSTAETGTSLLPDETAVAWCKFAFSAAHQLPNVPQDHPCGRMHGHNFTVILHSRLASIESTKHYQDIRTAWAPLHNQLNQSCLNQLPGLNNPTSEKLAEWIWQALIDTLPMLQWVTVRETHSAGCHYNGQAFHIWKDHRFEAAIESPDQRNNTPILDGHSYLLRIRLAADLHETLGWTVDFGEVKKCFDPMYRQLDHHLLNNIASNLHQPTTIAKWVANGLIDTLPSLQSIEVYPEQHLGTLVYREHSHSESGKLPEYLCLSI